jgi:hypothetical protein
LRREVLLEYYNDSVPTSQRTQSYKIQLSEVITVCSEGHAQHIKTVCGRKGRFLSNVTLAAVCAGRLKRSYGDMEGRTVEIFALMAFYAA